MANSKSTKRALLTSALALLMCVTMLVGTTFAWFTDTASTGVNKIQAGNLKVDIIGEGSDTHIDTLSFVKAAGADGEELLWEPGCRYLTAGFRIANKGNLALKWKAQVNKGTTAANDGGFDLLDVIDFYLVAKAADGTKTETPLDEFSGKLAAKTNSGVYYIKGVMRTTAGNDYQGLTLDGITITVVATQDTVENDSFGNGYDAKATYPVLAVGKVKANDETVLKDKPVNHTVKLTAPAGSLSSETQKLMLELVDSATPATITVTTTQDSKSIEVKLKDQNGTEVSAIGGKLFTVEVDIGKDRTDVAMYHDGVKMTNDGSALKDEDNHFVYDKATGYVTMKVSHFSPFTAVYTKANWGDVADDKYETPVDEGKKVVTIASAEELALFAKQVNGGKNYKGYTVKLVADIDLGDNLWTPIGKSGSTFQGVFDGQGKTISNLLINEKNRSDMGLFGFTTNGEIKNFTLHNAQVTGYLDVGAVAGTPYTSKYSNIKLTGDVQINGFAYVGGMFGKNAYANLTDLTIDVKAGSYVNANSNTYRTYVGGLVGFMGEGKQTVRNVTSNIDVTGTTCDVGGITGIAHYGNTFINCHSSGDVTLTAAPDAAYALEVGGIAGVWLNTAGYTVTLTGCSYTGKLSSYNVNTGYVKVFSYDGLVGHKYDRSSNDGTLTIN